MFHYKKINNAKEGDLAGREGQKRHKAYRKRAR